MHASKDSAAMTAHSITKARLLLKLSASSKYIGYIGSIYLGALSSHVTDTLI